MKHRYIQVFFKPFPGKIILAFSEIQIETLTPIPYAFCVRIWGILGISRIKKASNTIVNSVESESITGGFLDSLKNNSAMKKKKDNKY
ncbi:hypothetical protein C4588_01815 [Candidatus Parcubacteria bacterium]|nr:MAG: hypothetical protein C4588_01815 [Candidatus Parcubacteria bacterium]